MREKGIIVAEMGKFGFIERENREENEPTIFIHVSSFEDNSKDNIKVGNIIEFDLQIGKNGKSDSAKNSSLIGHRDLTHEEENRQKGRRKKKKIKLAKNEQSIRQKKNEPIEHTNVCEQFPDLDQRYVLNQLSAKKK